jgi:SWI/SNF-related matrix-associated actin-dependent regulator 1 of chromatin subfamily A
MPKLNVEIPLKLNPYDYQKEGIAYGIQHGSIINGDAPGLGKTGQSIATVIANNQFPCLIICPASLKYNWEAEWNLWSNHRPVILTDSIKHTWSVFNQMGTYDVFIVNYESLKKYFVVKFDKPDSGEFKLKHVHFHPNIEIFKSVIVDESHRVKEPSTLQTKLTAGICLGKNVQLLTGTPIVNRPVDLLSQLSIIGKLKNFGGSVAFREMCADNERWPEINSILRKDCYFRREKKDVLKELPDKYRQKVFCSITNQDEYDAAMADLESYLREFRQATEQQIAKSLKGKIMVQIGVLKNISARGKLADVMEYIDDVMETGEKIVVFIYLSEVGDLLRRHYPNALFFTGSETSEKRNSNIQKFQECKVCGVKYERHTDEHEFVPSDHNLICVNYKAGGVGITLTAASRVAFVELPWHSADTDQCEDRCHRISQKNAVQITYFLGKGTIDESIYKVINDKREMSSACTGAIDNTEESTYESLIKLLN